MNLTVKYNLLPVST